MTKFFLRKAFLCLVLLILLACGSQKNPSGKGIMPIPDTSTPPEQKVDDAHTLKLRSEALKLTHITQEWKTNLLLQPDGAEDYMKLQKRFPFPIQFNGWVTVDHIAHDFQTCAQNAGMEPQFILNDDQNGQQVIHPGDKVPVRLEKIYDIIVELENTALCQNIDVQFGVLYGTNDE